MSDNKRQPEEHEFTVDNKESVTIKDAEMNERINKLFGEVNEVPKKELKDYDPLELQQTRKKLLFLFVGVIIAGIIIVVLLLNPLEFNFGKGGNNNSHEENNNLDVEDKPSYPLELNLFDENVKLLNQQIEISLDEQKNVDLFPIYMNENTLTKDIPNNIKLLYLKKSDKFYNMLQNNKVNDYVKTCDKDGIVINKVEFDQVYSNIYGKEILPSYDNINYEFFTEDYEGKKITLTFDNDKYIVKCNNYSLNNDITKFVQQELIKAVETETTIELYQKVVFVTYSGNIGVYKEPTFKTLITNDKNAEFADYIALGNTYKYTFDKNENDYYLSKIELLKEDN